MGHLKGAHSVVHDLDDFILGYFEKLEMPFSSNIIFLPGYGLSGR